MATMRHLRIDDGVARAPENILVLTAALSAVAALIHVEAAVDHYSEYRLFSASFVAMAVFQAAWAAQLLRRPSPHMLIAGVIVSAAIVLVWLTSRTVGLPIGPDHWRPEAVGAADLLATYSEVGIIA